MTVLTHVLCLKNNFLLNQQQFDCNMEHNIMKHCESFQNSGDKSCRISVCKILQYKILNMYLTFVSNMIHVDFACNTMAK